MSGPKVTVYYLTTQQKRIIAEQISCENQSVAYAKRIQEILQELDSYSEVFETQMRNVQLLVKRTSEGADQVDRIQVIRKKINDEIKSIRSELFDNMPSISVKHTISEEVLFQKLSLLKRLQKLKTRAEELMAEFESIVYQDKRNTSAIQSSIIKDLESTETEFEKMGYLKRNDEGNIRKIQDSIIDDLKGVYLFSKRLVKTTGFSR